MAHKPTKKKKKKKKKKEKNDTKYEKLETEITRLNGIISKLRKEIKQFEQFKNLHDIKYEKLETEVTTLNDIISKLNNEIKQLEQFKNLHDAKEKNKLEAIRGDEIDDILDEIESNEQKQTDENNENRVNWGDIINSMKSGDIVFIKNLISSNSISINEQNPLTGKTLLIYATSIGQMQLIKSICNAGADINIVDNVGLTALDYAQKFGHYKITELLYYQQLSGSLGTDLKRIATQIHDKQIEATFFIQQTHNMRDIIHIVQEAIIKTMPFSSDLLFYCWQYIVSTDNKPLESPLFKTMMKTYEEILRDTHNKKKWEWIKEYFIVQLIWYLPHPNIINQENENKMNDENVNTDETLKTTELSVFSQHQNSIRTIIK